jgi:hypothetical protein
MTFYFIFFTILIEAYFIFALFYIRDYFKLNKEKSSEKKIYLPLVYSLCFILLGISQVIGTIFDCITEFSSSNWNSGNFGLWKLFIVIQSLGFVLLIYPIDKFILKGRDRHLIIILFLVFSFLPVFSLDFTSALNLIYFTAFIVLIIPIGFIYISITSKGILRKKSLIIGLGQIMYFFAAIIFIESNLVFIIELTNLSRVQIHGISLLIESISIVITALGFRIPLPNELDTSKISIVESLGLNLIRRAEITEEEISISKEKKICLVCKGKLSGFNLAFICSGCDTLYCEKCARTLSTLENACWVCDIPFDESKPVKLPEEAVEEILVEEGIQKKK